MREPIALTAVNTHEHPVPAMVSPTPNTTNGPSVSTAKTNAMVRRRKSGIHITTITATPNILTIPPQRRGKNGLGDKRMHRGRSLVAEEDRMS